jgi:uncharacterized protein (TIGR02001 family)
MIIRKSIVASAIAGLSMAPAFTFAQSAPAPTAPATASAAPAAPYTLTGNVTLASDYTYRGVSQTNRKPAIQGGFDFSHSSGLYLGTWLSNVSWLSDLSDTTGIGSISNSLEWDFYGGYKGSFAGDFSYDVGVLQYYYPGNYPNNFVSPDTLEVYGSLGWKTLSLKYSHAVSNLFGFADSKNSYYVDLTGTYELPAGFNLVGHVGYQAVKNNSDYSYTDWKIGVTKEIAGLTFGLAYIDTNADKALYTNPRGRKTADATAVLTIGKTF